MVCFKMISMIQPMNCIIFCVIEVFQGHYNMSEARQIHSANCMRGQVPKSSKYEHFVTYFHIFSRLLSNTF